MPAPSPGTSTAFRLARIAALVLGCLVFLHACERSAGALPRGVWLEIAIAAVLGAAGLGAGWFEVTLMTSEAGRDEDFDDDYDDHDDDYDEEQDDRRFPRSARHDRVPISGKWPGPPHDERGDGVRAARSFAEDRDADDAPAGFAALIAQGLRIGRTGVGAAAEVARRAPETWRSWTNAIRGGDSEPPDDEFDYLERTETGELVVEADGCTLRVTMVGELVFHGRSDGSGRRPKSEWRWTFGPDTFPAVRAALGGGDEDLLDLLELAFPELEPGARQDPGAWLRAHDIPATYREKGVSAAEVTRELPVLRPVESGRRRSEPPGRASDGARPVETPGGAAAPRWPTRDDSGESRAVPRSSGRDTEPGAERPPHQSPPRSKPDLPRRRAQPGASGPAAPAFAEPPRSRGADTSWPSGPMARDSAGRAPVRPDPAGYRRGGGPVSDRGEASPSPRRRAERDEDRQTRAGRPATPRSAGAERQPVAQRPVREPYSAVPPAGAGRREVNPPNSRGAGFAPPEPSGRPAPDRRRRRSSAPEPAAEYEW